VGAGIGGLVAAIALSKKGHKVTVLEAASQLGEVCRSIHVDRIRSAPAFKFRQIRLEF
jgi:phytoene dehydrogenase-like protein